MPITPTSLPESISQGQPGELADTAVAYTAINQITRSLEGSGHVATRATGSDQVAGLQSELDAAAAAGEWFRLNGDHVINSQLLVPSGARIDGSRGSLTQTGIRQNALRLNSVSDVVIRDVVVNGKTTDYVNNSTVYGATGVYISGTSSNVTVEKCRFLGVAGAGVYIAGTASNIEIQGCVMVGAGSTYILNTTYNYSGGVVADTGASDWSVSHCDISEFAQGVVTGEDLSDVRITNNHVHDIPGQHGLYLETINGGIISNNFIRNTGVTGMKIQVGTTGADDSDTVVISNNCFINVGVQGVLLTNAAGGTPRIRRTIVTGNLVSGSGGRAIEANNSISLHIADNVVYNAIQGVSLTSCSAFDVTNNRIDTCTQNGITITSSQDGVVEGNRVTNPGSANTSTAEFGIQTVGATTADITFRDNKVTDANSNMRYAFYIFEGDLATMDFIGNRGTGASDYGYRGLSAAARTFRLNTFSGTTGALLTPPTNFVTIPDTSGAALASVEAEVNKLKAVLRSNGLILT